VKQEFSKETTTIQTKMVAKTKVLAVETGRSMKVWIYIEGNDLLRNWM
jgi:hypothetical protein